jgi:hypothetical protein
MPHYHSNKDITNTKYGKSTHRNHRSMLANNNGIIHEYFRFLKNNDIDKLLDLFSDDAVIYEPFSNISEGLRGKNAIKPFLEVAMMANDGLQYEIEFQKLSNGINSYNNNDNNNNIDNKSNNNDNCTKTGNDFITALVTFEKGGSIQARFTFELEHSANNNNNNNESAGLRETRKIKSLHIQFLDKHADIV